ncbi:MAG: response regulator receiver protein [Labilithrix sp.]|nr:response regulator receiver protein [Labilithrix sp.]
MAKTLLAVDDSVTMRKVLEITFSGEDFRVITAENAQTALAKLGENPGVFVVDTVLGGEDGYALAKELRRRAPGAPILMLASRYAPYDQARGRDAGADDFADKPFDTQQLIDKVRKIVVAKEAAGPAAAPQAAPPPPAPQAPQAQVGGAPPVAAAGAPYRAPAPPIAAAHAAPVASAPPAPPQASGGLRTTQQSLGGAAQSARSGTLVFGDQPPAPRPAAPAASPAPPAVGISAVTSAPSAVGAAVNGHLSGKLGELGLSPQQAEAVLALSREVVERVVWEVVPQLAETMIKEEIQRLMKE